MNQIEYEILEYVKNTNKIAQIKEVRKETIESIFCVTWAEFTDIVNKLVEKNYLTKPFYSDNNLCSFNSNITYEGLSEVEKYDQ